MAQNDPLTPPNLTGPPLPSHKPTAPQEPKLTDVSPLAYNRELRQLSIRLSLLEMQLQNLNAALGTSTPFSAIIAGTDSGNGSVLLPPKPLQAFFKLNPPEQDSGLAVATEMIDLMREHLGEQMKRLGEEMALVMQTHRAIAVLWDSMMSDVLDGWTPKTRVGILLGETSSQAKFEEAQKELRAYFNFDPETGSPRTDEPPRSEWTKIDDYLPGGARYPGSISRSANAAGIDRTFSLSVSPAGVGIFASAHFVKQALLAQLAYRRLTALIEFEIVQNHAQHAASISETVRAGQAPYRHMPLGGCTTIPASVWRAALARPSITIPLAACGNPLVVFQCVQDWIENGAQAALPRMLAALPAQEQERLRGVGRERGSGRMLWQARPVVEPARSDTSERAGMAADVKAAAVMASACPHPAPEPARVAAAPAPAPVAAASTALQAATRDASAAAAPRAAAAAGAAGPVSAPAVPIAAATAVGPRPPPTPKPSRVRPAPSAAGALSAARQNAQQRLMRQQIYRSLAEAAALSRKVGRSPLAMFVHNASPDSSSQGVVVGTASGVGGRNSQSRRPSYDGSGRKTEDAAAAADDESDGLEALQLVPGPHSPLLTRRPSRIPRPALETLFKTGDEEGKKDTVDEADRRPSTPARASAPFSEITNRVAGVP
ncbi:hypothetical protein OC835_002053 [Tilletia horrida]|nr:hypothetical protein OC835_002053 [Tilletia horrida]